MTIKTRCTTKNVNQDKENANLDMLYRKNNTIHFYRGIDRPAWLKFSKILHEMNEDKNINEIILRISSSGGQVSYAFTIASLIENNNKPIHGIVDSECCSSALFILLACKTKTATRCSEFLIHEGSVDYDRLSTTELIKIYNSEIILEKEIKDYILTRTKIKSKQYDSINMDGIIFYSSDAIKYGIISKIV